VTTCNVLPICILGSGFSLFFS